MLYLIRTFLLMSLACNAFSQTNYTPATITTSAGKVLEGFVDSREWAATPTSMNFKLKNDAASPVQTLTPDSISSVLFTTLSIQFVAYHGKVSMDETDIRKIKNNHSHPVAEKAIFLEMIRTGKHASLYQYIDDLKTRYFLSTASTSPEELVYKAFSKGTNQFSFFKGYQNQIFNAATAANTEGLEKIKKSISKVEYNYDDLTTVVDAINGAVGKKHVQNASTVSSEKVRMRKTNYFAGLGVITAKTSFTGETIFATPDNQKNGVLPSVTLGADIYFKPIAKRTFLRLELASFSYTAELNKVESTQSRDYNNQYKLSLHGVGFNTKLNYHIVNGENMKWYAGAGIGLNYAFKNSSIASRSFDADALGTVTTESNMVVDDFWISFIPITGVRISKFDFAVQYLPKRDIFITLGQSISLTGLQVNVLYTF
jgi:hypothetical protein